MDEHIWKRYKNETGTKWYMVERSFGSGIAHSEKSYNTVGSIGGVSGRRETVTAVFGVATDASMEEELQSNRSKGR